MKEYSGLPRLPWPNAYLNNARDPNPKRQEAIYLPQMHFRKDLELSWKKLYAKTKKTNLSQDNHSKEYR